MAKIKKILITAGPTREHLDPVRFITNLSTGEMGYALARAARKRGCQVSLVSGPTGLQPPRGVKFHSVVSAKQMQNICSKLFRSHDCLIMTAAVCDFMPETSAKHKIPSASGLTLRLKRTPDILASLAKRKGKRIVIGFCLETRDLVRRAVAKLRKKQLDGIVANYYRPGKCVPFGKRAVDVVLVSGAGQAERFEKASKTVLAGKILGWMDALSERRGKNPIF